MPQTEEFEERCWKSFLDAVRRFLFHDRFVVFLSSSFHCFLTKTQTDQRFRFSHQRTSRRRRSMIESSSTASKRLRFPSSNASIRHNRSPFLSFSQTSNIKHQTSNIKHQTSNSRHQTSNKHQTAMIVTRDENNRVCC